MVQSVRRRTGAVVVAVGLGAGLVSLTPVSASARPDRCSGDATHSTYFTARCTGGTGEWRAWLRCEDPLRGSVTSKIYSAWRKTNAAAVTLRCPKQGNVQFLVHDGGEDIR